jgi:hemerythrin-like domain-containing protein
MERDPIEQLLKEHRDIMAQVEDLREVVQTLAVRGENGLPETLPVFNRIGRMMATELELHRHKEDDILFPALEAIFGAQGGPTYVMRQEHEDIHAQGTLLRETLYELNEVQHPAIEAGGAQLRQLAVNGGSADALKATGEEIIELLDLHFGKEEAILFPMARNILEEDTMQQIARDFERLAAEWPNTSSS